MSQDQYKSAYTGPQIDAAVGRVQSGGIVGAQGPQGPAGPPGPQGVSGPPGPGLPTGGIPGQIVVKNSTAEYDYTWKSPGSIPELMGPMGPQGLQGVPGERGPAGAQGPQGIQGPAGSTGPQGPQGPVGPMGPQGPSGVWWVTVTIQSSAWNSSSGTCTVTVEGIEADETAQLIQPVPSKNSYEAWVDAEIHVVQDQDKLTFIAQNIPSVAIVCYIVVTELSATGTKPPIDSGEGEGENGGNTGPGSGDGDDGDNYTEVEYIELKRNVGIDIDDVTVDTARTRVILKFKATSLPTSKASFFTTYNAGNGPSDYYVAKRNASQVNVICGSPSTLTSLEVSFSTQQISEIEVQPLSNVCWINDKDYKISVSSATLYGLVVGGISSGSATIDGVPMYVYSVQIYTNQMLSHDLIPVKDSNGIACLYNKKNGKYYQGFGGTVIAGPEV